MASTEEEIGKGTKKVENSLWKGPGNPFRKKDDEPESKPSPATAPRPGNKGPARSSRSDGETYDFDGLSDEEKQCANYVVSNYSGEQEPAKWASYHSQKSGLPEGPLSKLASRFRNDLLKENNNIESVYKYPIWSAARDWDPEMIGKLGGKMSSGLNSFKFDPDMVASVRSQFY